MQQTSKILKELEKEAELTRRALEPVPEGKSDWKPHPKSMPMGQLAHMIATMPSWIAMMIKQNELDVKPKEGSPNRAPANVTAASLVEALNKSMEDAKQALSATSDEHLETNWKLLNGGKVVMEGARSTFIGDLFKHLAHHRGQLTVYLRMNDAPVPAIYGPSADDQRF